MKYCQNCVRFEVCVLKTELVKAFHGLEHFSQNRFVFMHSFAEYCNYFKEEK